MQHRFVQSFTDDHDNVHSGGIGPMSDSPFGLGSFAVIGVYLLVMIGLAVAARRVQGQRSLSEFYLANRSLGPVVLLLTLYATQYSGNSLLGLPGEAHRVGYFWVLSMGFMMSVVGSTSSSGSDLGANLKLSNPRKVQRRSASPSAAAANSL